MFLEPDKIVAQFELDPSSRVVDLGAGVGTYAFEMGKAVSKTGVVYAVDVQKELLSNIKNDAPKHNVHNIEVVWGDIEELHGTKFNDSSLDAALIANTLFQLEDKETAIKEANRILKMGGKLLIVDWTDSFGGLGPHADQVISPSAARHLVESNGFSYRKEISAGAHHYGMMFVKES